MFFPFYFIQSVNTDKKSNLYFSPGTGGSNSEGKVLYVFLWTTCEEEISMSSHYLCLPKFGFVNVRYQMAALLSTLFSAEIPKRHFTSTTSDGSGRVFAKLGTG